MPVYEKLQLTKSHTEAAREKNRRIALNLLRLRQRLRDVAGAEDHHQRLRSDGLDLARPVSIQFLQRVPHILVEICPFNFIQVVV